MFMFYKVKKITSDTQVIPIIFKGD